MARCPTKCLQIPVDGDVGFRRNVSKEEYHIIILGRLEGRSAMTSLQSAAQFVVGNEINRLLLAVT